jgi:hypothetical protein
MRYVVVRISRHYLQFNHQNHLGKVLTLFPFHVSSWKGFGNFLLHLSSFIHGHLLLSTPQGPCIMNSSTKANPKGSATISGISAQMNLSTIVPAFRTRGVPGPTSKLLSRAPAQMGRRETEREGGKSRRETGVKGETRGLRVCPAPRSGALAVGGYKRPRGRERGAYARVVPSFPARPTSCKRALDFPFIGVRRGSRCTMGGVAVC